MPSLVRLERNKDEDNYVILWLWSQDFLHSLMIHYAHGPFSEVAAPVLAQRACTQTCSTTR